MSISLAWDPSPSTNVTAYTVYYGHTSENYSTQVDAGNQTSVVVQGIDRRTNYFFAVTARTSDGLESLPSNEVNLPPETNPPQIAISTPVSAATFSTTNIAVNLGGTGSDDYGLAQITWSNQCSHASGIAVGTTSWTVANVSLCVGTNVIVVTAKDAAGNTSSDTITIIRSLPDTTSPQIAITGPTSNATFATTNASINLGGSASDASGVTQVSWSNQCSHASGVASGTASWTVANVSLCVGTNVIVMTAKDAAGNTSSDTITIIRSLPDTTSPQIAIASPTSNATLATTNASVILGGSASDASGVTQVSWSNQCSHASGVASGTASWTVATVSLCVGTNVIVVTAKDAAGNASSDTIAIIRSLPDTTSPQIAIASPTSAATFATTNASINLGGSASDASGVTQVSWSNQCSQASGVAVGTTNWTVANVALCVGTNVIVVSAKDAAGNTSSDTITIIRSLPDTTSPQVAIASPTSAAAFATTNASVNLGGSVSDAAGVTQVSWSNQCSHASGVATGTASWTVANVSLCVGTNIVVVTAKDATGNTSSDTITIIRSSQDATSPQLMITGPTSFATFATTNGSVNLGGLASDASGVMQVSWSNHCSQASGVALGTTSWSVANVSLCLGTNVISITANDPSGNVGTYAITIIRHQPSAITLPQVTVISPVSNFVTTASTIDFAGTASGGLALAEVSWSNSCSHATGLASGTTSWAVTEVALCLGTNIISFTARDTAGNFGSTEIAIVRNGPGCGYTLSAKAISFEAAGGSGRVGVTAGAACDWTSVGTSDWIKITSGYSGSGNGIVSFSVDPNFACSPRSANLLIAGQNFTVTQAAGTVEIETVSGTFNGFFTGPVPQEGHGLFTLKKGTRTGFTGNIKLDGKQYSFSGTFDSQGLASTQIRRAGTNALFLELHLEPCSPDILFAVISDGGWSVEFSADRSAFNAKTEPAPYAGQYTIAVAGVTPEASLADSPRAAPIETSPEGIGFATVRVMPNGLVKVAGNVGDGERFVQSAFLSKGGVWSCYVPLYRKAGLISGSLTFHTGEVDPQGTLHWNKPAISKHKFYPAGFSKSVAVIGSPYQPPVGKTGRVLNFSNGTVILDGNNPAGGLAKDVKMLPGNKVVPLTSGEDRLSFRINKNAGTFSGTIKLPSHARPVKFKGGLLQNQNAGYGLFLSTDQSGQLLLEPTPE